ncbi:hypothetical protein SADUNF_Sadunf06G0195600 [Salix dunnii]|uniref:Uncharacterized protein n=1 Tax=Salix dunnii TaxID=1413687 RepID=A0A835K159_9ROSI|nr:hypothetical protein SADUNF_Sadunf06G0195600 [Salix dunnii]
MVEAKTIENIKFKWGKQRGVGGKKKDVKFYESFSYDGVEYALYDSVYMYKEGETEPYIGKLIKIWENADKTKKVKVLWFFRPHEISHYLRDEKTPENELFLASGEGVGSTNVNPLEAIAGKCNVVCSSKDSRNPQSSDKELQEADFVFYRTFDVGNCRILDNIDDKIAGIEVKLLLNRVGNQNSSGVPKLDLNKKEARANVVATNDTRVLTRKKSYLREKATCSSFVKFNEVTKINDRAVDNSGEMASSSSKVKQISYVRPSLANQNSSPGENSASNLGSGEMTKDDKKESIPSDIITSSSKDDVGLSVSKVDEFFVDQFLIEEKVKVAKESGDTDDRTSKKPKLDYMAKASYDNKVKGVQKVSRDSNGSNSRSVAQATPASEDKSKPNITKDPHENYSGLSKRPKPDEGLARCANGKFPEASLRQRSEEGRKTNCQIQEVTRRPEAPWEERMQTAHEQGTLVLLLNLDPSYTSAEVEDIIWHAFKQSCTVKMIQRTAHASPHSGQAFVIFQKREEAEMAVAKLDEGCLMLSNGRPLVGSIAAPCFPGKHSTFFGHLVINKLRIHRQRVMKEAVSTSHCSQPNTLEYEMAMDWCLLQERSDLALRKLRQLFLTLFGDKGRLLKVYTFGGSDFGRCENIEIRKFSDEDGGDGGIKLCLLRSHWLGENIFIGHGLIDADILMGCAQSKVDSEESVSRCKERKILMKEAVAARNAFAAGHSGYASSLKNTGAALSDYGHGEANHDSQFQQPSSLDPASQPPTPPPPPSMDNLPPPPPPLPIFSTSPIKRAMSMPEIVMNGKQMGDSDVIVEEEEEEVQELRSRNLSRKNKDYENSEKVSQRGPQNNGNVGLGEDTRPRTPPRTVESYSSVVPPMPEAKNTAWDYFLSMDNMPISSLDPEEDMRRNGGNFGNVENVGVGFGDLRGGIVGGGGKIDEVEPKTPEKAGEKMDPVMEEEEGGGVEKKERKQIEHSQTAPLEFRAGGRKGGSAPTVNLMQVLNKIDDHFLKASESAQDVCKMLEATRLHYHSNFADNRGHIDHSARVMRVITWNRSFKGVPGAEGGKDELDTEDYETHATVLDKLLAWEKKLYDEVKQGELMKLEYKKKVVLLNKQKKRGASTESLEKTKAAVSHLHTRYIVDMQSMDSTVSEVNQIRDQQLYPKLVHLVDGMAKMWASMCSHHDSQLQIVTDLKSLDVNHAIKETSQHHHERTIQLLKVVQGWHLQFEKLVTHQKQYIHTLTSWLKLNLIPIESSLKEKISSPLRAQSPPIQALLHSWQDNLEKLPDELAKSAISSFAAVIETIVHHQEEEMKLKEKSEETRKEFLRKNQAFDEWYQKYMQRRTPDETDADRGEDTNPNPVSERQFAVESLKKRLEEEVEAHKKHCLQVREKSVGTLKLRLPELFHAMSDYAHACSSSYEKLREMALFKKWGGSGRETIYLGRTPGVKDGPKPRWKVFWRKINRGKKKIFKVSPVTSQASYDPDEYSQNFDQGTDWSEPEFLSRSFSARYADPSRILLKSKTVR